MQRGVGKRTIVTTLVCWIPLAVLAGHTFR